MNVRWQFLLILVLATTVAMPAVAKSSASIPDFSGLWAHPFLNALEQPLSGPGPVRNISRRQVGPQVGAGNHNQLVGDYRNPILQPWAAEVLRKFGEISLAGKGFATPRNQCWPEGIPFALANYGMQLIQRTDKVTILYPFDHQVRQVRMNRSHSAQAMPSWYGDSVGHYEGDTLVIDTVGIKVGRFSMIDWFGTPYTQALHVVERYRLLDYDTTMEAVARAAKEHLVFDNPDNGPLPDPVYRGKGLQVELTIEDKGAYTMPWSSTVTYRRALDEWWELVCADNPLWYPGTYSEIPAAEKPDF